jgi:hypothetical protein
MFLLVYDSSAPVVPCYFALDNFPSGSNRGKLLVHMSNPVQPPPPEVRFRIRSHDPQRSNEMLIEQIQERKVQLLDAINAKLKLAVEAEPKAPAGESRPDAPEADATVDGITVTRDKAFGTGIMEAIIVAFLVGVGKGAGEVTGKKLAEAFIDAIKDEFSDVEIIQLHLSDGK